MIHVTCYKCKEELIEPGGLCFSPPCDDIVVCKLHLCKKCWIYFMSWIDND